MPGSQVLNCKQSPKSCCSRPDLNAAADCALVAQAAHSISSVFFLMESSTELKRKKSVQQAHYSNLHIHWNYMPFWTKNEVLCKLRNKALLPIPKWYQIFTPCRARVNFLWLLRPPPLVSAHLLLGRKVINGWPSTHCSLPAVLYLPMCSFPVWRAIL